MTAYLNGELIEKLDDTLSLLTKGYQDQVCSDAFDAWCEKGDDPEQFDWVVEDLHRIDTPQAKALCLAWQAYTALCQARPKLYGIYHIETPLTRISKSYIHDITTFSGG